MLVVELERLAVDCPNERVTSGDSIDCTVYFADGSFKSLVAKWDANGGNPKIHVDVAK